MSSVVVHLVGAARPNFMKVAPLFHVLGREAWCRPVLIHTGQHYDANMSGDLFRDLRLPEPEVYLGVGSGAHGELVKTQGPRQAIENSETRYHSPALGRTLLAMLASSAS